ncbi:MAG: hypothetical protein HY718_18855 [Planctomycetes bacterium]|nr:hypothetical protein [Planctomycetota bacterium]
MEAALRAATADRDAEKEAVLTLVWAMVLRLQAHPNMTEPTCERFRITLRGA